MFIDDKSTLELPMSCSFFRQFSWKFHAKTLKKHFITMKSYLVFCFWYLFNNHRLKNSNDYLKRKFDETNMNSESSLLRIEDVKASKENIKIQTDSWSFIASLFLDLWISLYLAKIVWTKKGFIRLWILLVSSSTTILFSNSRVILTTVNSILKYKEIIFRYHEKLDSFFSIRNCKLRFVSDNLSQVRTQLKSHDIFSWN